MISSLILTLVQVYSWVIIIYCVLTWIPTNYGGVLYDIRMFFEKITDPYLRIFQNLIPRIGGTVDVSPILALLVLQLAGSFLARVF